MLKPITTARLETLANNHKAKKELVLETDSVIVTLKHLQEFITQAQGLNLTPAFDAIKIYFIRYELNPDQDHIRRNPPKDLSQVSLAFVPAHITDRVAWTARDLDQNGNISALLICEPKLTSTRAVDDETGLCPPRCNDI